MDTVGVNGRMDSPRTEDDRRRTFAKGGQGSAGKGVRRRNICVVVP